MCDEGLSLIECIVSLLIGSVLLAITAKQLSQAVYHAEQMQEKSRFASHIVEVETLLEKIKRDIEKHPLAIYPKVHKQGLLHLSDGSLHKISSKIHTESNAISYFDCKIDETLSYREELACPIFKEKIPAKNIKSFIALTQFGAYEYRNNGILESSNNCYRFNIEQRKSVVLHTSFQTNNILLLIPVRQFYTYFVDNKNTLRLLSTDGERIKENQPLINNISPARFAFSDHKLTVKMNKALRFRYITFFKENHVNFLYHSFQEG